MISGPLSCLALNIFFYIVPFEDMAQQSFNHNRSLFKG